MKNLKILITAILISLGSTFQLAAQDVGYVPTRTPVLNAMLRLADVKSTDVVYDLGCGDGRIVIASAKEYGARGVGIDIDPVRIEEANQNAKKANVTHLVEFREADLFESDFSEATVVTLYLLNTLNEKLKPILLEQLKPGTRVVSHAFEMGDWEPEFTREVDGTRIFMWTVPEKE